jgi:hypothetical protein
MTIQVTLFHTNDKPLEAGVELDLVGDGQVIATATVGENGVASFAAGTDKVQRLAVRISQAQTPQ